MLIKTFNHFPKPETAPSADWSALYDHNNEHKLNYFAYAVKRDFLSTPRTYAILELEGSKQEQTNIQVFARNDYFTNNKIQAHKPQSGFYLLFTEKNELPSKLLLLLEDQLIEINYAHYQLVDTLYYCLDSNTALTEFIENN